MISSLMISPLMISPLMISPLMISALMISALMISALMISPLKISALMISPLMISALMISALTIPLHGSLLGILRHHCGVGMVGLFRHLHLSRRPQLVRYPLESRRRHRRAARVGGGRNRRRRACGCARSGGKRDGCEGRDAPGAAPRAHHRLCRGCRLLNRRRCERFGGRRRRACQNVERRLRGEKVVERL